MIVPKTSRVHRDPILKNFVDLESPEHPLAPEYHFYGVGQPGKISRRTGGAKSMYTFPIFPGWPASGHQHISSNHINLHFR